MSSTIPTPQSFHWTPITLTGANCEEWLTDQERIAKAYGLDSILLGTETEPQAPTEGPPYRYEYNKAQWNIRCAKLLVQLNSYMSPVWKAEYQYIDNPRKLWLKLTERLELSTLFDERRKAFKELVELKFELGRQMSDYCREFSEKVSAYAHAIALTSVNDYHLAGSTTVIIFLNGLGLAGEILLDTFEEQRLFKSTSPEEVYRAVTQWHHDIEPQL